MNSVVYEIVFEDGVSDSQRDQTIDAVAAMPGVRRMVPVIVMTREQADAVLRRAFQDNVAATVGPRDRGNA